MLVLSRKTNESIVIDGRITVNILRVEGEVVKVGVSAPVEISVLRKEIYDEIISSNRGAVGLSRMDLQRLLKKKRPVPGVQSPPDPIRTIEPAQNNQ
jgi:carbon storage regulator